MNRLQRFIKTLATRPKTQGQLASAVEVKKDSLLSQAPNLQRKEPQDWLLARQAYSQMTNPRNDLLQDLYQDALLDAHLHAVQQTAARQNLCKRRPRGPLHS